MHAINAEADSDEDTIRISVDSKATIKIGNFSRKGKSRGQAAVQAADHDMNTKQKVAPGGILEVLTGQAFLFFTDNHKTSDFIADGIELWWNARKKNLCKAKRLVINVDNGPECSGCRSQFLQRMADFSDKSGLEIRLAYYPPYHSKYNAIEHYWGGLERSWNGYLLDSVETVLKRAANFTWKAMQTTVTLLPTIYKKGVKLCAKERKILEERLQRSMDLPKYDILITPNR